jgi:hypothetical protein
MNKSQGRRRAVVSIAHPRQRKAGNISAPLGAAVVPQGTGHDTAHANYTVFFSHKLKDKHVAHSIKRLLTENTADVAYFVSEDIEKGDNWHKAITEQLDNARFLVLVFTDPDEDWSWCLYETGFFDALARAGTTKTRRIHCLHHPKTGPPKPIAHLQPIPATKEEVVKWLTYLFDATEQPKTCYRDKVQIPQLANDICGFFEGGGRPLYSAKSVNIEVDGRSLSSPDDLPDDSIVRGGRD